MDRPSSGLTSRPPHGRGFRWLVVAVLALVALLAACAPGPNDQAVQRPEGAGFWLGVWHGLIAPITFVVSLFDERVGMYAVRNDGHLYDLGFLIGLSIGFGTFAGPGRVATRRRRRGATPR